VEKAIASYIRLDILRGMDFAAAIVTARREAGLTQAELAARSATSQPTLSAYEQGRKTPGAATLARLLAACGRRLASVAASRPVRVPSSAELERRGATLLDVIELAAALPVRHRRGSEFPGLPSASR
jgi:transcriptional regulator with XRE-family HTH domain